MGEKYAWTTDLKYYSIHLNLHGMEREYNSCRSDKWSLESLFPYKESKIGEKSKGNTLRAFFFLMQMHKYNLLSICSFKDQ